MFGCSVQTLYMKDSNDGLCHSLLFQQAIKKAAESLEKLADTARMELPGTMAAIRLSGMEISDLTMELNDLG